MTVSTTISRVVYDGNGAVTSFPATFPIISTSNLIVTKIESDGTESPLNEGSGVTNYSVSGAAPGIVTVRYPAIGSNVLEAGEKIVLQRVVPLEQNTDLINQGAWDPEQVEAALDYLTFAIQQLNDETKRSFKTSVGTDVGVEFEVPAPQAGRVVGGVWNDDATAVVAGPTAADITSAQTFASNAATSASEADDSATDSANSAAAAAAAAASVTSVWKVVRVSFADSPISIGVSDNGTQYVVDTSGGNVAFTLPLIADVGEPASFAVSKSTGDTNTITVTRSGTDLIDGGTSGETQYIQEAVGVVQYFADEDTTPDRWAVNTNIAATGNMMDEVFKDGVDYTAGVTTSLTLSKDYGSESNIIVWFDGVAQHPDEYSLSGTSLTFSSPITSGVSEVFVRGGTTLSIGVPADSTVTAQKIGSGAVTTDKIADDAITTAKIADDAVGADQLDDTAVTPGLYTNASVTVDQQGRVTAAANGNSGGAVELISTVDMTTNQNAFIVWDESQYSKIQIVLAGVRGSSDNRSLRMRLGYNNGTTAETSAYKSQILAVSPTTYAEIGTQDESNQGGMVGEVTIVNPGPNLNTYIRYYTSAANSGGGATLYQEDFVTLDLTESQRHFDAVQFFWSSGTFNQGDIYVYGWKIS